MKTLVLLSTLVLLAFQALADPLPEATEETKNKEWSGAEDQDVSISFGGPETSVLQDSGIQGSYVIQLRDPSEVEIREKILPADLPESPHQDRHYQAPWQPCGCRQCGCSHKSWTQNGPIPMPPAWGLLSPLQLPFPYQATGHL